MSSPRPPVVAGRVVLVLATVIAAAFGGAACGGSGGDSGATPHPPAPTGKLAKDAEVLEGRQLYARYCSSCHGTAGGGAVGPKFTDGRLLTDFPTIEEQVTFVRNGKGVMPAWGSTMSESELRAVVRYEREVLSKPQP